MTEKPAVADVLAEIGASYAKARAKHAPMRGPHEGYAVILEEFDELWDEIKAWQPPPREPLDVADLNFSTAPTPNEKQWGDYNENMKRMRKEALHVAAMALAFLIEVTP